MEICYIRAGTGLLIKCSNWSIVSICKAVYSLIIFSILWTYSIAILPWTCSSSMSVDDAGSWRIRVLQTLRNVNIHSDVILWQCEHGVFTLIHHTNIVRIFSKTIKGKVHEISHQLQIFLVIAFFELNCSDPKLLNISLLLLHHGGNQILIIATSGCKIEKILWFNLCHCWAVETDWLILEFNLYNLHNFNVLKSKHKRKRWISMYTWTTDKRNS